MGTRKALSKGTRFDIFRRDQFTCQYCGGQPPAVVLVVDHINPVALGGDNDPVNLVTSCQHCNQGKAAKSLDERIARPDADLMFLEVQQEIAEVRRYADAVIERKHALAELVVELQSVFTRISGDDYTPGDELLMQMLTKYDPESVEYAVRDVAAKVGGGYLSMRSNDWFKYMWAVARNHAEG